MNTKVKIIGLIVLMLVCLYFFICSLSIFKTSFQLLCSNLTTSFLVYANLSNPILGVMLGVVVTAFIQENVNKTTSCSNQTLRTNRSGVVNRSLNEKEILCLGYVQETGLQPCFVRNSTYTLSRWFSMA